MSKILRNVFCDSFRNSFHNIALFVFLLLLSGCVDKQDSTIKICDFDEIGEMIWVPPVSELLNLENKTAYEYNGKGFFIQSHEVTNGQFNEFVAKTGYVTDAEKIKVNSETDGGSAVFKASEDNEEPGYWSLDLGMRSAEEPYSGAYNASGKPVANNWQGFFPLFDNGEDGYTGIASIGCFEPNKLGVYDMIGNVWEWTSTPHDPTSYVIKGGSYLCAANYCRSYRPAARQNHETDFSTNHIGFRVVVER